MKRSPQESSKSGLQEVRSAQELATFLQRKVSEENASSDLCKIEAERPTKDLEGTSYRKERGRNLSAILHCSKNFVTKI